MLIINEVSLVGKLAFRDLNKFLRQISNNHLDFGGIPVLLVGDLFQLPLGKQSTIFGNPSLNDAWFLFKLHDLGDSQFAALLNRMSKDNHTSEDIEFINSLLETDIKNLSADSCKIYMTN